MEIIKIKFTPQAKKTYDYLLINPYGYKIGKILCQHIGAQAGKVYSKNLYIDKIEQVSVLPSVVTSQITVLSERLADITLIPQRVKKKCYGGEVQKHHLLFYTQSSPKRNSSWLQQAVDRWFIFHKITDEPSLMYAYDLRAAIKAEKTRRRSVWDNKKII